MSFAFQLDPHQFRELTDILATPRVVELDPEQVKQLAAGGGSGDGTSKIDPTQFDALISRFDKLLEVAGYRAPTKLKFAIPVMLNKQGVPMPGTLSVTDDHDVRVPLLWEDD